MTNPSMPFYPSDFMGETALFTNEQIGKYLKVLCIAYINGGKLTREEIISICGGEDERIFKCFKSDEEGKLYHERTVYEMKKREEYAKKKSKKKGARKAISEEKPEEGKKPYGNYKRVLLTDEQYEKLKKKYRDSLDERIEALDEYIEMNDKKYKSHYAVIIHWDKRNKDRKIDINGEPEKDKYKEAMKTYDANEFFEAALERSERMFAAMREKDCKKTESE
ncbi:MAG: hypothetical protein IJX51_06365 [Clostridia bacterium]|nr:hypothetical protein [Clostridia bacterium]